jgi:hypothetical protein
MGIGEYIGWQFLDSNELIKIMKTTCAVLIQIKLDLTKENCLLAAS